MTPLKFRAWDMADRKMYYLSDFSFRFTGDRFYVQGPAPYGEIGSLFLTQFTGLLDANGKEIYEGDIVGFNGTTLSIEWDERKALFTTSTGIGDNSRYSNRPFRYPKNIEVIGNIYENPELLK